LQAQVENLSNKLLSAGKSNQNDRLQIAKLHKMLSDQIVQAEHVSALAVATEQALKAEQRGHLATQQNLSSVTLKLEEANQESADLCNRVKIADDVLQALRETREVDVSDRFCLSSLVQKAFDEAEMEREAERSQLEERRFLLQYRSSVLDARERALESRAKLLHKQECLLADASRGHDKTAPEASRAASEPIPADIGS
jgi:hypothetical protein